MCFADYTDRITFQNQIWQFNEMSSLMKTFHNNKLYHDTFKDNINNEISKGHVDCGMTKINSISSTEVYGGIQKMPKGTEEFSEKFKATDIRFTKVLTKYSTEYNNILFIYNLSQELDMDKKDLLTFFQELRLCYGKDFYNSIETLNKVEHIFDHYNINKLDIKRIYRYLDKNVKKETVLIEDEESDEEI